MISTLTLTIVIETAIVIGYCIWRKKPVPPILLTSLGVNVLTQSFLWMVLNLFFQHYLVTLLLAEIVIWFIEGIVLCYIPSNRLDFREALALSFSMNLASFALGWFLPA